MKDWSFTLYGLKYIVGNKLILVLLFYTIFEIFLHHVSFDIIYHCCCEIIIISFSIMLLVHIWVVTFFFFLLRIVLEWLFLFITFMSKQIEYFQWKQVCLNSLAYFWSFVGPLGLMFVRTPWMKRWYAFRITLNYGLGKCLSDIISHKILS